MTMRLIDIGLNALVQGHTGYSSGAAVGAGALALLGLAMATSWQNKLIHKLEGLPSVSPYSVGALYGEYLQTEEGLSEDLADLVQNDVCVGRAPSAFLDWTREHHYDNATVNAVVHNDPYISRRRLQDGRRGHHFEIQHVDMKGDKLGADVGPLVRSLLVKHGLQDAARDLPTKIPLRKDVDPSGRQRSKAYVAESGGRVPLCFVIHPQSMVAQGFAPSAELTIWE